MHCYTMEDQTDKLPVVKINCRKNEHTTTVLHHLHNFILVRGTKSNLPISSSTSFSYASYNLNTKPFPKDLLLGVGSAAYSIEGAWNQNGKGESVWDIFTHSHPELIADGSNGDVACDSYHKIEEDVALLETLSVDHYRFSLSWSRILPKGFSHNVNSEGVRYYNRLIDALIERNITPVVTLYHWDLPQVLQEYGGWSNEIMSAYFDDYARIAFDAFGDRVRHWITFSDPRSICYHGYQSGKLAPGLTSDHNFCLEMIVKSHSKVYRTYNDSYNLKQTGKVGIALGSPWITPYSTNISTIETNILVKQYQWSNLESDFHLGFSPIFHLLANICLIFLD